MYTGMVIQLPFGQGGMYTDDAQSNIPATNLISANNVWIYGNVVEKMGGSQKYNTSAFSSAVVGVHDWWPTASKQQLVCVTADGSAYLEKKYKTFSLAKSGLGSLDPNVSFVEGGNEVAGRDKLLFLFTGSRPVQVLSASGTTMSDIVGPDSDWVGSYPTFGILHRSRIFALRNHSVYISSALNHQVFMNGTYSGTSYTDTYLHEVFPGEGSRLWSAFTYKGRLFVVKEPFGVYWLVDDDENIAKWYFKKYTDNVGVASPHSGTEVINDMLIGSSTSSVFSLAAAQELGDIATSDILSQLKIANFIRENTSVAGIRYQHSLFYDHKRVAFVTFRSTTGQYNDRILMLDYNKEMPRATWCDKDIPICLAGRKDNNGIEKPIYGSSDGFVYLMDIVDRNVGGAGFLAEFQTPHLDFGFADPNMANKHKMFDFVEVTFEPMGDWNLSIDVYIDGKFRQTVEVPMNIGKVLGTTEDPDDTFTLDVDPLSGNELMTIRKRITGTGKRISLKCYNSGVDENFRIASIAICFRPSAEQQIKSAD